MKKKFSDGDFIKSPMCNDSYIFCCVEVARKDGEVAVRDTKDPSKTMLVFTNDEWKAFIDGAKTGAFDV